MHMSMQCTFLFEKYNKYAFMYVFGGAYFVRSALHVFIHVCLDYEQLCPRRQQMKYTEIYRRRQQQKINVFGKTDLEIFEKYFGK